MNFKTYCTASNVGSVDFLRRSNKCVCARLVALACAFVRGLACALACALACEAAHALARAILNFARHRISSCNLFPIDCENIALQFPLCCCSLCGVMAGIKKPVLSLLCALAFALACALVSALVHPFGESCGETLRSSECCHC